MKLAAIDVGTNSIHTVIVEVRDDLSITILDDTKDTVHLARGRDKNSNLNARAMTDALAALYKAERLCESHGVEKILAVATSAIREAPNGLDFLRLVEEKIGVEVRVIAGSEEARLIYLAVRESIHLNGLTFLNVDIGGGSVEFNWATREQLLDSDSVKVGVLRMTEEFPFSDPATPEEIAALEVEIVERIAHLDEPAKRHNVETLIGTSGTIHQLARLAIGETSLRTGKSLHQQMIPVDAFLAECDKLIHSTETQRQEMKALDRTRLQTIIPGAILMRQILLRYNIQQIVICEYALREGVLYDYVEKNRRGLYEERETEDVRRRSVLALARRCNWDEAHCEHIAKLSLMMFDQLTETFGWDAWERDILEFAAMLHDIGMVISVPSHHRHGQYLIEHADLLGFNPSDIAILGNVVRYHRSSKPKKKHESYRALKKSERKVVDRLAGILRVTEALDRTGFRLIQSVHIEVTDEVRVIAMADGDAVVEQSLANERADLLRRAVGKKVNIELADADLLRTVVASMDDASDPTPAEDDE
ncbi:MAG: Ppx/GppA phosphatase family protein [Candidatus Poribacteria bacterium]|nr:Ppx/GppA phosphatase family protein [Candidatus Poribacteria bacterium]